MNVPRSVADVLNEHVVFEVDCIGCSTRAGLVGYVQQQLKLPIASNSPLAEISDRFTAAVHRFALDQHVPRVNFVKRQRQDDVMHEHLAGFTAPRCAVRPRFVRSRVHGP